MAQKRSGQGRKVVIAAVLSVLVLVIASALVVFFPDWPETGLPAIGCQPLFDGAVSWFNGEKIGSSAFFVDKLNNNVGLGNAASVANGKVGNAFSFAENMLVAHTTGGLATAAGTIEMWVKPNWNGNDNEFHGIWQLGTINDFGESGWMALFKSDADEIPSPNENHLVFVMRGDDASVSVSTDVSTLFQNGEWYHLAVTWSDSGDIKLYVNGLGKDSAAYSFNPPPLLNPAILGQVGFFNQQVIFETKPFNGLIDEVRLYDRALDAPKILQLSQSGSVGVCPFESNCADGDDDDGDGNVDCGDSDCAEHPACGSALETGIFCHNGEDDDDDDFIDCFDSSCFLDNVLSALGNGDGINNCFDAFCYTDQQCQQETCLTDEGTVGEVVWSYQLPSETSLFLDQKTPAWTGCCPANHCRYGDDNECVAAEQTRESKDLLCDTDQNWHSCQQEGQLSSAGTHECIAGKWYLRCSAQTKYWLEQVNNLNNARICDGEQWRTCADLALKPIEDLTVQIKCTGNTITVREADCCNALDDDNDQKADTEDEDCQGNIPVEFFGNPWYEVCPSKDYRMTLLREEEG